MRIAMLLISAALVLSLGACQSSHEPGVKSDYRTQWTGVTASPQVTTDAAKAVLEDQGLKNVNASSTKVDGKATAKKADGTEITVDVQKKGDGSEVTVNVGTMGDPKYGAQLANMIKMRAEKK
jgi:Zn-dependent membrane protease YugP